MTGKRPHVTVCVPAYNSERTIGTTLESILAQTHRNLKVIVSDNASTDNTPDIVSSYVAVDPRVRLVRHLVTSTGEANFDYCLKLGEGEYTAIFHADDLYSPTMVEEEVEVLESSPEVGVACTMAYAIDSSGSIIREYRLPPGLTPRADGFYYYPEIFRAVLKYGNFFFCPSFLARTRVCKEVIVKWDGKRYKSSADLDVWLRAAAAAPMAILNKPLLHYRVAPGTTSYKVARSRTQSPDIFIVLNDYVAKAPPGILSRRDLMNYRLQKLRDNVNRAFNIRVQGWCSGGFRLLADLFSPAVILFSLFSPYYIKLMVYGYSVLALYLLPLPKGVREKLFRLRFGA